MRDFETLALPVDPQAVAPDGTKVRLLPALAGGSLAHFELPTGAVSHAVKHRTVEEIWFFLKGRGEIWREREGGKATIEPVAPGVSITIPLGTAFQFRSLDQEPLTFLAITMPPWPGEKEAYRVEGAWTPNLPG
jgi:mannose-6-phosphate isomerase-like protein (cupin superfamily)